MNKLIRELAEQAKKYALDAMIKITDKEQALRVYSETYDTKFVELILIEVIATIYGSDIKDKKQDKLVDKLLSKFGMTQTEVKNE